MGYSNQLLTTKVVMGCFQIRPGLHGESQMSCVSRPLSVFALRYLNSFSLIKSDAIKHLRFSLNVARLARDERGSDY